MTCPTGCAPALTTFVGAVSLRLLHHCASCATVWVGDEQVSLSFVIAARSNRIRARQNTAAAIAISNSVISSRSDRPAMSADVGA